MPFKETKILEFNQDHKFHKVPVIIYVDLETLIEKIDERESNPDNHLQQNELNLFHYVFLCLHYHHLKTQRIRIMYTEVKIG